MKQYGMIEVYLVVEALTKKIIINKAKEITIDENDVLRIFSIYANKQLVNKVEDIIKVNLPSSDIDAKRVLNEGIEVEGVKYVFLATTTGAMKEQDMDLDLSGQCYFVNAKYESFVIELKKILSLGKINEKYNTKLCINKDIVSRISLAFSAGERVYLDNIKKAILPEMTYTYVNNYLQFAENKEGKIDLKDLRLVKNSKENQLKNPIEHTYQDGCGYVMPHLIDEIRTKLGVDYPLSWVGIREVGTASKGLLVRFDFKQYLKEEHGLDKLIVKDMWGNDVDLFEVDVIMNESQCKWAKWFNNKDEIEELIAQDEYKAYRKLFNGFNIVKYNKKVAKTHTESNYQIMSNLALTPLELDELAKESIDACSRIINKDVAATRIALGDIARENETVLSASTRMHLLLQIREDLINMKASKKIVESLVNKRVNTLAGASIDIKGGYKTMCQDPIAYFDMLAGEEFRGLKDKAIYIPGEEIGNRALARCPLNSATEILKVQNIKNDLYDKYFGHLSNDLIFIPCDDTAMLMSGADFDLDICFAIDDEIIYNTVIEDIDENGTKWYFHNQFDGDTKFNDFNKSNYIDAIVKCRGNAIGTLSNKGAIISNLIQEMPYRHDGKLSTYKEIVNLIGKDEFYKGREDGTIANYTEIDEEEIRTFIKERFQQYKMYSYFTLYCQMVAIDSVKTSINVGKEEKDILKSVVGNKRKPLYIYYAKYKQENKIVEYEDIAWNNSLLNNYAKKIIKELGAKARKFKESSNSNSKFLKSLNVDVELNIDLHREFGMLVEEYFKLRNAIPLNKEIKEIETKLDGALCEKDRDRLNAKLHSLKMERNLEFDVIDLVIADKYNAIKLNYNYKDIIKALCCYKSEDRNQHGNYYRIDSSFTMKFAFDELIQHLKDTAKQSPIAYREDEDGDIYYLFKNYIKVDATLSEESLVEKSNDAKKQKLGLVKDFRYKILEHAELTEIIYIDNLNVYNEYGQKLGTSYVKRDGSYIEDGTYIVDKFDYTTKTNKEYETAKSGTIYVYVA